MIFSGFEKPVGDDSPGLDRGGSAARALSMIYQTSVCPHLTRGICFHKQDLN